MLLWEYLIEVKNVILNEKLYRPDMEKHSEFAKIQYFANLHKDSVLGIKYLANNQTGDDYILVKTLYLYLKETNRWFCFLVNGKHYITKRSR
jgi:hypothetical protein